MKVEIWSDVVCPFCYIGKRQFEDALGRFEHADEVEVEWRSFELDPDAPRVRTGDQVDHLATKYGMSRADAQAAQDRVKEAASEVGLRFELEHVQAGNTFDAHRLVHLAAETDQQDAMAEALLAACFTEGRAIGDPAVLAAVAAEVGLATEEIDRVLSSDAHADAVRRDELEARSLGISGVPFFVVDRTYGVSGAQGADAFVGVLERAWSESSSEREVVVAGARDESGPACDDGACSR